MKRKDFLQSLGLISMAGISVEKAMKVYGPVCKTDRDAESPFYKKDAPFRTTISKNGELLKITGTVYSSNPCGNLVAGAVIDIWHCDGAGKYDLEGFVCRGQVNTVTQGKYLFETIYPPSYGNRPRHIHFKVRAQGFPELTTQLYFTGDANIRNDFARNAGKDRVIALSISNEGRSGIFNIYL